MKTHKKEPNKACNDSELVDETSMEISEKKNTGRRLQDGIVSKDPNRKLNLDRRVVNSDRRIADDSNYNGPARRNTIDRRLNLKDRRDKG
jgi:hypothetical protein